MGYLTCSLEIKCPQSGAASRKGVEVREGERRTELDLEVGEVMTRGRQYSQEITDQ